MHFHEQVCPSPKLYSFFPFPPFGFLHTTPGPLFPNSCKQWLKASGGLEKWKPKEAYGVCGFLGQGPVKYVFLVVEHGHCCVHRRS